MPIWETITAPLANQFRKQLELKGSMKLVVPGEDGLHTCEACLCNLKLKVWCPLPRIMETTPLDDLWEECWIKKEMKTQ